jgi:hypothetical protein
MTNIGIPARVVLGFAGLILCWGGPGEIGTRSGGSDSWADETSFMALQLRALGALKLGAGLGLIGASLLGVSAEQTQGAAHRLASQAAAKTEPKAKVQYPSIPKPPQIG